MPELRDRAGSALEEVDRLAKIVDALFAISRLDAGEAQQEWTRFDLAPLAASTTEQMSLLAEDKGISVACKVQGKVSVDGDRARIKQVVVNLLDNAIKYTPPGGSINLNVYAREDKAVIEVADTGIGIPAGALPHIFERFFRVDKARSRDAGGAGLGLAIVKSICLAHGGQVSVESSEGQGSRFKVRIAACPARAKIDELNAMIDESKRRRIPALVAAGAMAAIICASCKQGAGDTTRIRRTRRPAAPAARVQREDLSKIVPIPAEFRALRRSGTARQGVGLS